LPVCFFLNSGFDLYELLNLQSRVAALCMTWTLKYQIGHQVR